MGGIQTRVRVVVVAYVGRSIEEYKGRGILVMVVVCMGANAEEYK